MTTAEAIRTLERYVGPRDVDDLAQAVAAVKAALTPKPRKPKDPLAHLWKAPASKRSALAPEIAGAYLDTFGENGTPERERARVALLRTQTGPLEADFGAPERPANMGDSGAYIHAQNVYDSERMTWRLSDGGQRYLAARKIHEARLAQFNFQSPKASVKDDARLTFIEAFLTGAGVA